MRTVVISLVESPIRREFITNEIKRCNIQDYSIFNACNGSLIKKEPRLIFGETRILKLSYNGKTRTYDPRLRLNNQIMSNGELGCAWSHLDVYEQLIQDSQNQAYLILEDDASLNVSVEDLHDFLKNLPAFDTFDICHIFESEWYGFVQILPVNSHYWKIKRQFFNHTGAYIVTKNGARKLLNATYPCMGLPADDLLSNTFLFRDDFIVIVPSKNLFKSHGFDSSVKMVSDINTEMQNIITINNFGVWSRLGNQMFQYAYLRVISINNNLKIQLPKLRSPLGYPHAQLFDAFDLPIEILSPQAKFDVVKKENTMMFDSSMLSVPRGKNITVEGFFQSPKYFQNHENIIRRDFSFKQNIKENGDKFMKNVRDDKLTVALHIRRTDFLNSDSPVIPITDIYLRNAIKYINLHIDSYKLLVFTDDKSWCRENIKYPNQLLIEGLTDLEELYVMSLCDHFIISPSSFSWWAAWLSNNPDKIIISPNKWFSDKREYGKPLSLQESDIIPERWLRINVDKEEDF